jgi:hypothetical protein
VIWPDVPEPVPVEVRRECVDCGAKLPEPNGRGRPRIRCDDCRAGRPVPDWERPSREPDWGGGEPDWVRELLRPPLSWAELQARRGERR